MRRNRKRNGDLATRLVEETATVDLGGRELQLLHLGPAHTAGDLVVWDPARGFLAAGDLLEEAPLWLDGADVAGWSAVLDRLSELGPRRVLASHSRIHPDTALLHAHRRILAQAVRVAGMVEVESEDEILNEFEGLADALAPWGVEPDTFRSYAVEAVLRLRGEWSPGDD